MKFGIVTFPGSNCDHDSYHVVKHVLGHEACFLWHKQEDFSGVDCVVLPGGFSYGDYLRCGAIARFSPIMDAVVRFANSGGYVVGICNGFQVLTEAGLLPGALLQNRDLKFICEDTTLLVANGHTPWTVLCPETIMAPIAHHEGCYFADDDTLGRLEGEGRVVFRYASRAGEEAAEANPNGAVNNIAGIINERGNVLGMMPHPERNGDTELGDGSGAWVFRSIIHSFEAQA
ncbi:MAG TPA: phosphoribosylformylglycinamidine synthase I [Deltaproteobacteria bacterium]|nr:phosphoribosylformylglycinamidine synthase I [Deltaproteobacteria bacterium]HCP45802.1 phosphoribosylformylglycinamidine synthase I [Deltaproteobacteria bacterium]